MGEVFAPKYLAGLMSAHGYLRSRHFCQTPVYRGEAYPVSTWLTSWSRAIAIQLQTTQIYSCGAAPLAVTCEYSVIMIWLHGTALTGLSAKESRFPTKLAQSFRLRLVSTVKLQRQRRACTLLALCIMSNSRCVAGI